MCKHIHQNITFTQNVTSLTLHVYSTVLSEFRTCPIQVCKNEYRLNLQFFLNINVVLDFKFSFFFQRMGENVCVCCKVHVFKMKNQFPHNFKE